LDAKAYPIYDWTTEDVWRAPLRFGWDYNLAYDIMERCGIALPHQRCSPAFGEEPIGRLYTYKTCFPEIWEKMLYRVDGAATAARYARTQLYSFGGVPEKPKGVAWPDFLKGYLSKWGPKQRKMISTRLAEEINRHFSKTNDPILGKVAHPVTGLSWKFLLKIAMRGDLKKRKDPTFSIDPQNLHEFDKKYANAYEQETGRKWNGLKVSTGIRSATSRGFIIPS
jgi:predicted phosphoadenosine phosphosulfate sulfurtransferase